jgi:flagellar basal body P-ring formation protein FlgA
MMKILPAFAVLLLMPAMGMAEAVADDTVVVPVLVRSLAAGDSFAGATEMQAVAKNTVFAGTVRDAAELENSVAGRDMQAGKPVLRLQVKQDFPVNRNSAVTFVLKRGAIALSGTGTALEDGTVGSTIKMLNTATRSTVAAVVTGPGQVEIR